jgi:hypothetical protein
MPCKVKGVPPINYSYFGVEGGKGFKKNELVIAGSWAEVLV